MRIFRNIFFALAVPFIVSVAAPAQQPPLQDPLLDHLIGNWVLQGTIAGKPITHDRTATWVINHHYVAMHEVSREKLPTGQPAYEAMVYISWNPSTSEYGCAWLDTYGGLLPVSVGLAPKAPGELVFLFKDKDSTFHTTFTYLEKTNSWTWTMDNEENGKLSPFARLTMTPVQPRAK